jgi:hypothetical protein
MQFLSKSQVPVIPATLEAEIRIVVQSYPRHIVHKMLSHKTFHKIKVDGVAQDEGPDFKPQY